MRTLKKTLCLVLCLAMMAGLCAVAASATNFEDDAEIVYKEAVDVMTGIGVIKGVGDGSKFAPADTLNRASACAIITRMLQMDYIAAKAPFEDCVGHWGESEIAVCASEGIVNGKGDGTFGPDDLLTGSAWAKMVLVALGYDAEENGMTGDNWEINVAKLLKKTGLADTIKGFVATEPISRDEACEIAFNALCKSKSEAKGWVVYDTTDDSILGTFDTAIEAALAAKQLGSPYDYKAAAVANDTLAATFKLQKDTTPTALGGKGYTWYIDTDKDTVKDPTEVYVSDFIGTDTTVGTYTKGALMKAAVADAGKKATESIAVTAYVNGNLWGNTTWSGSAATPLIPDSSASVTLVKTAENTYNALYEVEALYSVVATKITSGENKGKYTYTFTRVSTPDAAFGSTVPASVAVIDVEGAYNNNVLYLAVTDGTKLIKCEAATPVAGLVNGLYAGKYLKVNGVQYNLAHATVPATVNTTTPQAVYLNTAGDAMYVGPVGGSTVVPFDGYAFVANYEIKAIEYSIGLMAGETPASIAAVAQFITDAGEIKVVNIDASVAKVGTSYAYKANGVELSPTFTNGVYSSKTSPALWAGYNLKDGVYTYTALTEKTGVATAKNPVYTYGGETYYMNASTVIEHYTVNVYTGAVSKTAVTGYANINNDLAAAMSGSVKAVVTANSTTKVASKIAVYDTTMGATTYSFAVYAGQGEYTGSEYYYNFIVDGEAKTYLAASASIATSIEALNEGDVVKFTVASGKVSEAVEISTVTGLTVTDNVPVKSVSADNTYFVNDSDAVVKLAPGYVCYDETKDVTLFGCPAIDLKATQKVTTIVDDASNLVIAIFVTTAATE